MVAAPSVAQWCRLTSNSRGTHRKRRCAPLLAPLNCVSAMLLLVLSSFAFVLLAVLAPSPASIVWMGVAAFAVGCIAYLLLQPKKHA
jgi:membrane protein YdbS with pleckstrin-like domain